jgi:hypothetical protein
MKLKLFFSICVRFNYEISQLLKLLIFAITPFLSFIQPLLTKEVNNVVSNPQVKSQPKPSTHAADLLAQDGR